MRSGSVHSNPDIMAKENAGLWYTWTLARAFFRASPTLLPWGGGGGAACLPFSKWWVPVGGFEGKGCISGAKGAGKFFPLNFRLCWSVGEWMGAS